MTVAHSITSAVELVRAIVEDHYKRAASTPPAAL
jgi:hypothetical protein